MLEEIGKQRKRFLLLQPKLIRSGTEETSTDSQHAHTKSGTEESSTGRQHAHIRSVTEERSTGSHPAHIRNIHNVVVVASTDISTTANAICAMWWWQQVLTSA